MHCKALALLALSCCACASAPPAPPAWSRDSRALALDAHGAVVFRGVGVATGLGPRLAPTQAALYARGEVEKTLGTLESRMLKIYCAPEWQIARFGRIAEALQARQRALFAAISVVRTDSASDGTASAEVQLPADALELQLEGLAPEDQAEARFRFWEALVELCSEQGKEQACGAIAARAKAQPQPPGPPKDLGPALAGGCGLH
jgi:hypothetical protein